MIPSTKRQRQLIGIGCGQLGIDRETKAEMLLDRYGKDSTTKIGKAQAEEFLRELASKGFKIALRHPPRQNRIPRAAGGKVVGMVSQGELEKMTAVARLIEWRVENGLALWMQKRFGIDRVRTSDDAYRVIEGLKKMFENQMKKACGQDWWVQIHEDPGVMTYIWEHCPKGRRAVMESIWSEAGLLQGQ